MGRFIGLADTDDVVDAHMVALAIKLGDSILTGDPGDLTTLVDTLAAGPAKPVIYSWP